MKRLLLFAAALLFLACFAAYVHTLNPAFRADDSPETIATSVTLGIQHPPAYPLQSLVGRLFSFVPAGAPAFRINLMAAFFGALTCALLGLTLGLWLLPACVNKGQRHLALAAAALAGLGLGFSRTFWSQCLAAKGGIYTLHSACMAALLLGLLRWGQEAEALPRHAPDFGVRLFASRRFRLGVLLFALGFGNHWETQALLLPATLAFAAFLLWGSQPWPFWRSGPKSGSAPPLGPGRAQLWIWPLVLAALGLSVYVYLPLRARQSPFMNWGDPRDWQQFWWVFQRQEYLDMEVGFLKSLRAALLGGASWSMVAENWVFVQRQGLRVLGHLFGPEADLGWPLALLSLLGAWRLGRACRGEGAEGWNPRARPLAAWLLLLTVSFAFVISFYFHLKAEMVWVLDVFLIPVYLAQALALGLGAYSLAGGSLAPGFFGSKGGRTALLCAPLLLGAFLYSQRASSLSQARRFEAYDFGQDLLLSAKRNAVVLAEGDFNTMPVYYLQQVAHKRPDLDHVTAVFLSTDWGVAHVRRVQPRLGIGEVPKAITGARAGDAQVLRAALGQLAQRAQAEGRPIQGSWFRQVISENVKEWENLWRPSGLLTELNGPLDAAEARRRLGLLKALRTRHLELDRASLDPSPEFALSNYGTAWMEEANFLRLAGDFQASLPLYQRALLVGSRSNQAEILVHYGLALASGGPQGRPQPDLEASAALFQRSLEIKPLFEAYVNLAAVCNQRAQSTRQGSYALEAEANARRALQLSPANPQAWNNLAVSLNAQGRREEARQTLEQALRLAPGDAQIIANLNALR